MTQEGPFAEVGRRIQGLRGKLTQAEFAARLGVDRKSVTGWETGKRLPDGSSLLVMRRDMGADLNYLLGGGESEFRVLSSEERTMVDFYREASPAVRKAALGALLSAGHAAGVVVHGSVGQSIQGDVEQSNFTIGMGKPRKQGKPEGK